MFIALTTPSFATATEMIFAWAAGRCNAQAAEFGDFALTEECVR